MLSCDHGRGHMCRGSRCRLDTHWSDAGRGCGGDGGLTAAVGAVD